LGLTKTNDMKPFLAVDHHLGNSSECDSIEEARQWVDLQILDEDEYTDSLHYCAIYKLAETVAVEVRDNGDHLYSSHDEAIANDPDYDESDVWEHDGDEIYTHSFKAVD